MVWGIFRPLILLPIGADNWQTERLRAVLFHELAHIKRRDWVMQMIAQAVCAVYWFNPLVWFAARWMRIEAEQACDDQVLNAGYQPTDYAQHLLDIVRNVNVASFASRAAVAMACPSKIEERLRTVLAENLNRHPITKVAVGIGLLVLTCFAVPIGAVRLAQAVDPKEALSPQIQEASTSNQPQGSILLTERRRQNRLTKTLKSANSICSKLARRFKLIRKNRTIFQSGSQNFTLNICQTRISYFVQGIESEAELSFRRI